MLPDDITLEVEPLSKGVVCINSCRIYNITSFNPGQFLAIGEHCVFLYKWPKSVNGSNSWGGIKSQGLVESIAKSIECTKDMRAKNNYESIEIANEASFEIPLMSSGGLHLTVENCVLREWRLAQRQEYEQDHMRMKLSFLRGREEDLIVRILEQFSDCHVTRGGDDGGEMEFYALSPVYLLTMMLEYSAANYDQMFMKSLLLTIGSHAQNFIAVSIIYVCDEYNINMYTILMWNHQQVRVSRFYLNTSITKGTSSIIVCIC